MRYTARVRAADYAISRILPEDLRQEKYDLSAKGVDVLAARIARAHPDKYADLIKQIGDLGRHAAWTSGYTVTPKDLRPVIDKQQYFARLDAEISAVDAEPGLDDKERKRLKNEVRLRYSDLMSKDTATAAVAGRNSIAMATQSGARGNAGHLQAILTSPGVYTDEKDRIIPLFVRSSFAEGVRPAESLAGTYGGRKSVLSTKIATAKGGFFSKMLAQTAARYNVTAQDCGTGNGLDLSADDGSLRGRVLARPTAGYESGTVIDRHVAQDLRKAGKPVIVRSPMTCSAPHGLCAKCFGLESDGRFPKVGEHIGETASTSVGEPVTQMALNCLAAGTKVLMADLSSKSIEKIVVGDSVMGSNLAGEQFVVAVTHTWDQGMQAVRMYFFGEENEGQSVTATPEHKVLTYDGRVRSKRMLSELGDSVRALDVDGATILNSHKSGGYQHCFDITVDHPDELFVLTNGLIVSNSKHSGGQAKGGKKEFSGFDVISQFVQVPTEFKDRAAVAEKGGHVDSIDDAPQGGSYVTVDGERHFVLPGLAVNVKVGDTVEAGHQLSDGLVNPADIVRLRGLGEGRRYFADRFEKILTDSGMPPHRRRLEVIARAAVDNLRVEDGDDSHDWLPDDNVTEAQFASSYRKPENTVRGKASTAVGKYLQAPALHYGIGTKLTPSMADRLDQAGFEVETSDYRPPVDPEMRRLQTATHGSGDWLADMSTSYLKGQLRHNTERASDTNVKENYHYAPRLAVGVDFGKKVGESGMF